MRRTPRLELGLVKRACPVEAWQVARLGVGAVGARVAVAELQSVHLVAGRAVVRGGAVMVAVLPRTLRSAVTVQKRGWSRRSCVHCMACPLRGRTRAPLVTR